MDLNCPCCRSNLIKRNGDIHNRKQNHCCLDCQRQFALEPGQKGIEVRINNLIEKAPLEGVYLEGICRIFDASMPWVLDYVSQLIAELPEELSVALDEEAAKLDICVVESDELWSFVGSKKNQQWLWLIIHSKRRLGIPMEVGSRDRKTARPALRKVAPRSQKKPSTTMVSSLCTSKPSDFLRTDAPVGGR